MILIIILRVRFHGIATSTIWLAIQKYDMSMYEECQWRKRKNLNAVKLKDIVIQDRKISVIYLKLKSILLKNKGLNEKIRESSINRNDPTRDSM
mgnify:CR=1 FL=1